MEQLQNNLRANQGLKMELAARRGAELSDKHPQLDDSSLIVPTEVQVRGGSMEQRIARVVGAGKKGKGKLTIHHEGSDTVGSDTVMKGGAHSEGMLLAKHLEKLHGAGFLSDFFDGFKSVIKPIANIASFLPGPIGIAGRIASGVMGSGQVLAGVTRKGRGRPKKMLCGAGTTSAPPFGKQVVHNVADSQLAPNVSPAVAYGNPPQAVVGFKRNTVGMGRPKNVCGAGMYGTDMKGTGIATKKTRAPSARGAMISKLMKENGMTLGQASKHLKEHGSN